MEKKVIALSDREQLTEMQQLVFESILKYKSQYGYAPSIREICQMVGLASTSSVYGHLRMLEEKGYIARRVEAPRAIAVL